MRARKAAQSTAPTEPQAAAPSAFEAAPSSSGSALRASASATAAGIAASIVPLGKSAWDRFVEFSYRHFGQLAYPSNTDFCNCGIDMGTSIPRADLVKRDDVVEGTREWRMQLYGAALYWHLATTPGEAPGKADVDMLRGKDVLEVACMRGGGARYLKEVAGPRLYVATDAVDSHVERCRGEGPEVEGLRFEVADAAALSDAFAADTFDVVMCVQAAASFGDLPGFGRGLMHVLRPEGRVILCDALSRQAMKDVLDALQDAGLEVDVIADLGRNVDAVGLCKVPRGVSYLRIVARKPSSA